MGIGVRSDYSKEQANIRTIQWIFFESFALLQQNSKISKVSHIALRYLIRKWINTKQEMQLSNHCKFCICARENWKERSKNDSVPRQGSIHPQVHSPTSLPKRFWVKEMDVSYMLILLIVIGARTRRFPNYPSRRRVQGSAQNCRWTKQPCLYGIRKERRANQQIFQILHQFCTAESPVASH